MRATTRFGSRHGSATVALLGLLAITGPAYGFESLRINLTEVTSITSAMSDPDRGSGERTEQHRIVIVGNGNLRFDKSVPKYANRNDLEIRINIPMNVSAARRGGRNAELLSRAETGHASACLSFATRVLSNSKQFNLRLASETDGIQAGTLRENKTADGRDQLIVRISEDNFEDVRCTLYR